MSNEIGNIPIIDNMKELMRGVKEQLNSMENRLNSMETKMTEGFKEIEEGLTKKLNPLKDKMSLMEDRIALYSHQATGGGMPKEVRLVPGGYGLLEPRSTWRRERYGR